MESKDEHLPSGSRGHCSARDRRLGSVRPGRSFRLQRRGGAVSGSNLPSSADKSAIRAAWRFDSQYFSRQRNRLVIKQVNTLTGAEREIDASTGRTLPRR
jgi:hypothetical protein